MSHCWISTAELEGVSAEGKSSEAKVTVADLLCRTLHSFWPCFHSCPPFPHTVDAQHYSLFVPSRLSFSFFFSRTHTPSFLVFPLSPRINPCQPSLITHCIMVNQTRRPILAALPHSRRLVFAASSALPPPRCLILVALPLLSHPRCLTLAPTSSLQLLIFAPLTLLTLINRPLQVLLSPRTSGTPSFGAIPSPASCLPRCLLAEQVYLSHAKIRQTDRMQEIRCKK